MRYLVLLLFIPLAGCAGLALTPEEQVQRGGEIASNLITGNYVGALGQTVDLALILLGLKGVQKGAAKVKQVAKAKLINPSSKDDQKS